MTGAPGLVSLVGAGPGDPELITVRGLRRLQQADAVVYDRLVSPELLAHCHQAVEHYDVGKTPGGPRWQQEGINALLIERARAGRRVVRLKGGDPFVFGRGGEEALALATAGVPCEVVPGVSAALAAPAAAGIPVTHRGLAAAVTIATGHLRAEAEADDQDWAAFARMPGTLVLLMAVEHLAAIVRRLIRHGRPADEPAALVRWATTPQQVTLLAPLHELPRAAAAAELKPPATLVVGPTVGLVDLLASAGPAGRGAAAAWPEPLLALSATHPLGGVL